MGADRCNEHGLTRRDFLRYSAGVTAAVALGGALAGCGSSTSPASGDSAVAAEKDGDTLAFMSSEGYFADEVVKAFENKYGIKVVQTYVVSGDDMQQKVAAGLPFDVALTNSSWMTQLITAKKLRPIDHEQLSNWTEVEPFWADPFYDPGARYSSPWCYAPVGLGYQADKVTEVTGSFDDLWTWAPRVKGVYMLDDQRITLGIGLLHLGYDMNSCVESEVAEAADAIIELKPYLAGFLSTTTIQFLENGQASLVPSYTGNVYTALLNASKERKDLIRYVSCKEGGFLNSDLLSIPASAAHPGNGMLWLDWYLSPENMRANVNWNGYPVGTKTGEATYSELIKDFPFLEVSPDMLQDPKAWNKSFTPEEQEVRNRAWVRVQAA